MRASISFFEIGALPILVFTFNLSTTPLLGPVGVPRVKFPLFIVGNLLANDINPNPGPENGKARRGRKPKYPCGLCGYAVKTNCIQCTGCNKWFYDACSGASDSGHPSTCNRSTMVWICTTCDDLNITKSRNDSTAYVYSNNCNNSLLHVSLNENDTEKDLHPDSDVDADPPPILTTSCPRQGSRQHRHQQQADIAEAKSNKLQSRKRVPTLKIANSLDGWRIVQRHVSPIKMCKSSGKWTLNKKDSTSTCNNDTRRQHPKVKLNSTNCSLNLANLNCRSVRAWESFNSTSNH